MAAASIYDSQGRYDQSLSAATHAVVNARNCAEDSSAAHEQLGMAYLRHDNATEALRQAQLAITLDPSSSSAHNLLGYVNERVFNRFDLAEQEYRQAISLNNLNVRALVNLGLLLQKQNRDLNQAEDCFRKAVAADDDDWQAHLALAQLLYKNKDDRQAAEAQIRKAIELDPAEYCFTLRTGEHPCLLEGALCRCRKRISQSARTNWRHERSPSRLC